MKHVSEKDFVTNLCLYYKFVFYVSGYHFIDFIKVLGGPCTSLNCFSSCSAEILDEASFSWLFARKTMWSEMYLLFVDISPDQFFLFC